MKSDATVDLVVADLFCGAGGMSAGFDQASYDDHRFKIAFGLDHDEDAIQSFRAAHFGGMDEDESVRRSPCVGIEDFSAHSLLSSARPETVDVLIGGPSCQGVSVAGFRNPADRRNLMLTKFIDMIREVRPLWYVIENVPGLTHSNNRDLLLAIFEELTSITGYEVAGDMLLAADYGVAQLRYRLFIVGTRTGKPIRFPEPTHIRQPLPGEPAFVSLRDALAGLEPDTICGQADQSVEDRRPIPNHVSIQVSRSNVDRIASMRPGDDWRDMPISLLPDRFFATRSSDQKGAYGRLRWDWPAYTITNATHNVTAGCFTHPDRNRPLSVRFGECSRECTPDLTLLDPFEEELGIGLLICRSVTRQPPPFGHQINKRRVGPFSAGA